LLIPTNLKREREAERKRVCVVARPTTACIPTVVLLWGERVAGSDPLILLLGAWDRGKVLAVVDVPVVVESVVVEIVVSGFVVVDTVVVLVVLDTVDVVVMQVPHSTKHVLDTKGAPIPTVQSIALKRSHNVASSTFPLQVERVVVVVVVVVVPVIVVAVAVVAVIVDVAAAHVCGHANSIVGFVLHASKSAVSHV